MRLLYSYIKKYWKLCLLVIILAILNQIFSLLDPLIFRHIIDDYATKFGQYSRVEFFRGVTFLIALAIGVAFVSRLAKNFQDYFLNKVTQKFSKDVYADGVEHSLELPYMVFEDQRSGELLGTLQKVRADSEKFIASVINVLLISLVGFFFVTLYAFSIFWLIAVVYASIVPIIAVLSFILTRTIKKIQIEIVSETTSLAGSTTESLRNIELVKSLGLVDQEVDRLNATSEKILLLELKKLKYLRSISFIQGTLINLFRSLILLFLLWLVFKQTITVGQFFSLYLYSFFIFGPLQEMGTVITNYRDVQVSFKKFKDILDIPKEPTPTEPKLIGKIEHLEYKNVSFSYGDNDAKAIKDISFTVAQGKTIAFVGPSGSGKTTLVKLLVGLYKPTAGNILFNTIDRENIVWNTIRKQFGLVTQDTQLFAGTLRENLIFVYPEATDQDCIDALTKAAATSLLSRSNLGLDMRIGEGGIKVSGGEKQRISIARALLRKPRLLIFDEATSSLDSLTEESITSTIRDIAMQESRITVLIAHRLSTVMHADCIYVLEKGVISESGTHYALLEKKGLYFAMWRQQIGER